MAILVGAIYSLIYFLSFSFFKKIFKVMWNCYQWSVQRAFHMLMRYIDQIMKFNLNFWPLVYNWKFKLPFIEQFQTIRPENENYFDPKNSCEHVNDDTTCTFRRSTMAKEILITSSLVYIPIMCRDIFFYQTHSWERK